MVLRYRKQTVTLAWVRCGTKIARNLTESNLGRSWALSQTCSRICVSNPSVVVPDHVLRLPSLFSDGCDNAVRAMKNFFEQIAVPLSTHGSSSTLRSVPDPANTPIIDQAPFVASGF
eukprot:917912-Amphidinium_carterae.1